MPERLGNLNWKVPGAKPQLLELENFLPEQDVDIDYITETFLSPAKKIFISGFSTYRLGQANGGGGRAAISVLFCISHTEISISIRLISCYVSPHAVLIEAKIDSVFLPNTPTFLTVAGDRNVKQVVCDCRQTNPNRLRLVSISFRKGLTVEAFGSHT